MGFMEDIDAGLQKMEEDTQVERNKHELIFNPKEAKALRSKNDKTFLKAYLRIPNDRLNDIPNDTWKAIIKRLREMPAQTKSNILNELMGVD